MYRKPYDILTVQNSLVNSACWVTDYTFGILSWLLYFVSGCGRF